jgi:large subunit ribosomal protein L11
MAKITKIIKLQLPAGKATAAPPVGTALGPAGINIGEFVRQYNDITRERVGDIVPVVINVYDDRTFNFVLKTSPASRLLLKAIGKDKGSSKTPAGKVGKVTQAQLEAIAQEKMVDLNAADMDAAKRIIAGTAKSMGIEVVN